MNEKGKGGCRKERQLEQSRNGEEIAPERTQDGTKLQYGRSKSLDGFTLVYTGLYMKNDHGRRHFREQEHTMIGVSEFRIPTRFA